VLSLVAASAGATSEADAADAFIHDGNSFKDVVRQKNGQSLVME
jgi:hypothetical protein